MTCIKNGAYVSLPDYGLFAPADIYTVAGVMIVRFNGDVERLGSFVQLKPVTHVLYLNDNGGNLWWRKDLGVAVVPAEALLDREAMLRERAAGTEPAP